MKKKIFSKKTKQMDCALINMKQKQTKLTFKIMIMAIIVDSHSVNNNNNKFQKSPVDFSVSYLHFYFFGEKIFH